MGQAAGLVVGVALIFPAVLVPQSIRAPALAVWFALTLYAFGRAMRITVVLRSDGAEVRNYVGQRFFPCSELEAIVPSSHLLPSPAQGRNGCAGFLAKGSVKPFPAQATMSWGWRFGKPSRQAQRISTTLQEWGERHGVPVSATPTDLVSG